MMVNSSTGPKTGRWKIEITEGERIKIQSELQNILDSKYLYRTKRFHLLIAEEALQAGYFRVSCNLCLMVQNLWLNSQEIYAFFNF